VDRSTLVCTWRFTARPARDQRSEGVRRGRSELVEAFRSGHGHGGRLELIATSGPHLAVRVRTFETNTARWFSRVIVPSFPPQSWEVVPNAPDTGGNCRAGWAAHRIHPWPEPLTDEGVEPALTSYLQVLRSAARGATLRWQFEPQPVVNLRWWESPPTAVNLPPRGDVARRGSIGREPPRGEGDSVGDRPLFWSVAGRVEFERGSPAARAIPATLAGFESASRTRRGNGIRFRARHADRRLLPVGRDSFPVTQAELAGFWPNPKVPLSEVDEPRASAGVFLPLGRTSDGIPIGPRVELHQGRHLAVLGETGMGKSSLLISVARRAFRTAGGIVFDPLGDTVRSLYREFSPAERQRTLWIAPDAVEVCLNALEGIGGHEGEDPVRSERRLTDLVHALRRVRAGRYVDSGYWGPRLEEMVTRALRAAANLPDGTLGEAHTLLATSGRAGRPVPPLAIDAVRELADRIRDRPEDADGARRLIHEVVRSPVLFRMLCSGRPSTRTRDLVVPGRIVLVSGDAAQVGEATARYLLSVLLALVWSELLARGETAKTFVVLDEAQWFSHDSLAEMLRLGRRKNVHVIVATQAIASLPEAVSEAVWTNVSDFRGSPEEAREFSRAAPAATPEAILSLARGHAAVLIGKGEAVRWLRTVRLPDSAEEGPPPSGVDRHAGLPKPPPAEPSINVIFEELRRRATAPPDTGPLRVDVAELRRMADPSGVLVRRVGTHLAQSGILTEVDRSGGRHDWLLDRGALIRRNGATPAESPAEHVAISPKPS
jgi:hypothetical protein